MSDRKQGNRGNLGSGAKTEVQRKVEVIRELLRIYGARRRDLSQVERALRSRSAKKIADTLAGHGLSRPDPTELRDDPWFELRLVALQIGSCGPEVRARMIEALPETIRSDVLSRMFTFSDILRLDDVSVQLLLRTLDTKVVALALLGAGDRIVARVLDNVSRRAAAIYREEMEYAAEADAEDVIAAREEIARVLRELVESGRVSIR